MFCDALLLVTPPSSVRGYLLTCPFCVSLCNADEIELRDRTAPQPTAAPEGSQSGAAHVGDDGPDLVDL